MNEIKNDKISAAISTIPLTLQVRFIEDLLMDIRRIIVHEEELKKALGEKEVKFRLEDLVERSRESLNLLAMIKSFIPNEDILSMDSLSKRISEVKDKVKAFETLYPVDQYTSNNVDLPF